MAQWNSPGEWAVSEFYLDNINALAYHLGFSYIPELVSQTPGPGVYEAKLLLDTISPIAEHLKEEFVQAVVQQARRLQLARQEQRQATVASLALGDGRNQRLAAEGAPLALGQRLAVAQRLG